MKLTLLRRIDIEEVMKKQIIQILHNLIEKRMKPGGKPDADKSVSQALPAAELVKSGGTLQDRVVVRLVDRKSFERIVDDSLDEGQKQSCLLVCDVDRCREINDIYGHDTGDAVLRNVTDVLCSVFGGNTPVGSLGGDVFALWLTTVPRDSADDICRRVGIVNDRLLHPTGELPPVSVSVGVAFSKTDDDCKSLVKRANRALYLVKESGRCGCEMSL